MTHHLVLLTPDAQAGRRELACAEAHLRRCGWTSRHTAPTLAVWTQGGWPADVTPFGDDAVLIGEVFQAPGGAFLSPPPHATPRTAALHLSRNAWGAYIAVWPARPGRPSGVFRDPTGAREALIWSQGALTLVASSLHAPGLAPLLPAVRVQADRVGRWLLDTREIGAAPALEGIAAVGPGELRTGEGASAISEPLWRPSPFAGRPVREEVSEDHLQSLMRDTIDQVLGAYARLGRPLLAEISGGLDSAIMAASLHDAAAVRTWLNVFSAASAGDERAQARGVAAHLGLALTELERPSLTFDQASFVDLERTVRPSFSAMDAGYDRTVAAVLRAEGAWGAVTGQGGDSVFFNLRTPLVAADRTLAGSGRRLESLRELAMWTRTSVWRADRAGRRARRRPDPWPGWSPLLGAHPDLLELRSAGPAHPWLRDLEELDPAKRLQVGAVTANMLAFAECRRSRIARLIHGPLQQPVLELCLRIPASRLVRGGYDRALARRAFADRLPSAVIARRGKGDLTAVYGQELARSLPWVRDRLLGGRLRTFGLLDIPVLEARLTTEALMWRGGYADLLELLAIETWVEGHAGASRAPP